MIVDATTVENNEQNFTGKYTCNLNQQLKSQQSAPFNQQRKKIKNLQIQRLEFTNFSKISISKLKQTKINQFTDQKYVTKLKICCNHT